MVRRFHTLIVGMNIMVILTFNDFFEFFSGWNKCTALITNFLWVTIIYTGPNMYAHFNLLIIGAGSITAFRLTRPRPINFSLVIMIVLQLISLWDPNFPMRVNWLGSSGTAQEPWNGNGWNTSVSIHSEASFTSSHHADQERSCSNTDIFKLDWNLHAPTWAS